MHDYKLAQSKLVREYREKRGVKQTVLAKETGVSKHVMYNIEKGTTLLDPQLLKQIARVLRIPEESLIPKMAKVIDLEPNAEYIEDLSEIRDGRSRKAVEGIIRGDKVVLRLWIGILAGEDGECSFVESSDEIEVFSFLITGKLDDYDVLKIAGTSMSPRVEQGDLVLVRRDPAPPVGCICVVQDPEHNCFLKVLRTNEGKPEFHSLGKGFRPITSTYNWTFKAHAEAILHQSRFREANIEWDEGRPLRG